MERTRYLAAGYVALAVADSTLAGLPGARAKRLRRLTKPALMPMLVAATPSPRRGVTAAQLLSWAGDVALLGTSEKAFLGGLGSFLGAHVAYGASFVPRDANGARAQRLSRGQRRALAATAVLSVMAVPAMTVAARRSNPGLEAPVAAYGTALLGMVASALALDPAFPRQARYETQLGAALFLVSDSLLGVRTFVLHRDVPALDVAVMATYTAGQGLIAAGSSLGR